MFIYAVELNESMRYKLQVNTQIVSFSVSSICFGFIPQTGNYIIRLYGNRMQNENRSFFTQVVEFIES